jgi:GNAT superfamily N-acetyltransferase/DNA-binding CsgD family transcriptional regulator
MSDLFPDDPVAVQARRQAAVRGLSVRPDDPPLFDLGESFNAIRRGAYLADEGISGFGSRLANIPNTALETPSYFHQSEAQHRLTDPTSYERTDFAAWLDEQANVNRREIRRITPDPNSISQAQQILSGVLQPITAGLVGAPLGPAGPALTLGAGFGAQSYDEQIEAGVDPETAERVAIGQAGLGAVMGVLPASAPIRGARFALWPALGRAASGAAINVGTGIVMRQSVHDTLMASENGDYSAQAERYLALDGQALMVDAILGAAFGTIFAHVDSVGTAPRGRGEDGGPLPEALDDEPSAPILSAEEHLDAATEAYNDGDLVLARAHALMADRLGEQEGAFLAEQWAREGGEEAAVEGDALGLIMAMERGLIKPTPEQIHAAMVMGDDINARVTTAPGIPLNVHADVVHAENLRAYDEAAANGEEFPPARWDDGDAESFAPHPEDNFVATEAEDAIRNVLEQEGFSDLARDIETRRERIRSMGGAIDPGDMYFSRRGESAERRSEAFHDARLSPQQNKAVEMALNNYSNAEIADELDVSLAQVSVVLTNARRRAPNVEIEHARLGTTPGTHGGRRTATIEEIVALHNRLARQGYSNKLGNPVAGRRNLNTVIGERLGLSPKNIAKRLSEYRAGLRDGRIEGEALYSVARPGAGGRPNVNLNFIRRMLSEGETDLVKVTEALNEHRRELGMPPTTEQAVRSQAALDRRLNRTELNVATNEMQTTRRTGVEPSESAFKNMSRVLGAVESIARENGGAPPPGWQDAVAAETGYSPRSVSVLWDRIKAGEFGDELAARANTIPNAGRSRSAQRVLIGRLMDQGLSRQAITERVNVVRDSENKPPMTPQNVSSVMTQIRDARLNGDMRYSMTEDGTFSTPEDLKAAAIEAFGSDWNVLARAGNVEVVQTSADVPAGMFGLPRGVQAVHMRDTRTTYFIANNVRPEDMKGLILHEVGVHHGFEAMVGKRGFKEVLRQIERMIDADHPALVQARAFAERYSARDEHIPEETLAYLIETQADMPLVNSVLSKLRQWLVKTFGSTFGMQLTVDDLRALAITSLRRVAEQARREAGPAVEVLPIQDAVILASNGPDARPAQGGRRSPYQEELRAQGFDVESPLYRGMTRQAEGGDFTRNTDLQGSEQFHGTSFSRSTSEANLYAMEGDGGAVYPAYMRGRLESGPDYMRAVQARARESGVTNQEAARQVQQEYAQRGVTGVEWPPDRYGKGGEVRIFDQSNTASPFGANAPRTAPDGGPVQAGRGAERITMYGPDETGAYTVEATVDGKLVGRTDLFPHEGGFAPEGGQVIPAFQRQGVMSRILQHAEQEIGASLRRPMGMTDEGRAMWEQYASRRTAPNAGSDRNALQRALRERMERE